ncbi:MAG: hypothetical protein H3C59_14065 [Burkholderiaceae bacterium]|nr:hypothetical protein [Burkholderiaceae bacterium]
MKMSRLYLPASSRPTVPRSSVRRGVSPAKVNGKSAASLRSRKCSAFASTKPPSSYAFGSISDRSKL